MNIATLILNPANTRRYQINFPWLNDGETIVSSTMTVAPDDTGIVLGAQGLSIDQRAIIFSVSGSEDTVEGTTYLIDFSVTTSLGQVNYDRVTVVMDSAGCS